MSDLASDARIAARSARMLRDAGDYSEPAPTLEQANEVIEAMERFFAAVAGGEDSSKA